MRSARAVTVCACVVALLVGVEAQAPAQPDLSGFWSAGRQVPADPALVATLPPDTVVLRDAGATEFPAGEFGGLRPTAGALALAKAVEARG